MHGSQAVGERIYFRQLPGGGYVAIDAIPLRTLFGQRRYRGRVVVERRLQRERRLGHDAPAVASAEHATVASVFHDLFPLAYSNAALAAQCLATTRGVPRLD